MRKSRVALVVLLLLTSGLLLGAMLHPFGQPEKRRAILQLMVSGIEAEHYEPIPINDSLSDRIYKLYLRRLNWEKLYFTQEDMDRFKPYEFTIDSAIEQGTFEFYDLVNKVFDKRLKLDSEYVKQLLSKPIDYTVNEDFQSDVDKVAIPKNENELKERWRKFIKYQTLGRLATMLEDQDKATEKKDTAYKMKPYEKLEDSARVAELKFYRSYFHDIGSISDTDKISEYFDVIANCFDPHTEYFAPEVRKDFDISMSGQLEGIGAQLEDRNGNITVKEIIPGSPAWKNGELKPGDVFIKVAQGKSAPVDVVGMKLGKAVQLIRGKKGTEVRLTVKSGSATKVISLIRDVVQIKETYAHAAILDNNGQKMGYIRLPEFYTDFEGEGGRRCSDDMKKLVVELEHEEVKGIIIDLRSNGGGSLQEVVKMAGLFVPKGPIVQIKGQRRIDPLSSNDTGALYKGPLVVLVNGASASASEIFAAAMQDYKRGVIMGTKTYGKGTVQQVFTLDDKISPSFNNLRPLGSVKITISKFYRINGETTQKDGVTPDVQMPDPYQFTDEKEKDADFPLSADKIPAATYKDWSHPVDVSYLSQESGKRTNNDTIFNLIREEAQVFKRDDRDSTLYPLNLAAYRKQENRRLAENKRFDAINKPLPFEKVSGLANPPQADKNTESKGKDSLLAIGPFVNGDYNFLISATTSEKDKMRVDTNEAKTENAWLKRLTRDPELFEATRVISDMK